MRADSHPGPEPKRSTSEVLSIDAALTFVDLAIPPCYARPGHTSWHNAEERSPPNDVRFSTESGHAEVAATGQREGGTSRPSAFAILRLTSNVKVLAWFTGSRTAIHVKKPRKSGSGVCCRVTNQTRYRSLSRRKITAHAAVTVSALSPSRAAHSRR